MSWAEIALLQISLLVSRLLAGLCKLEQGPSEGSRRLLVNHLLMERIVVIL